MALEMMDRSLRYFLCIAELGSLSRAAEALEQSQSGLSKQLAALETGIGAALFVRTGRGVTLTELGAALYAALRPAYQDIDRAVAQARQNSPTHGAVRLASIHTLSYYFASDVVAKFISRHPSANLSLLGRSSPEVVELVASGKADLGFVYDVAVDVDTVVSRPLFEDEMSLIVRHDSSIVGRSGSWPETLRLVGFPPHYALRRMLNGAGVRATYVAEAETIDAMLQLVSSGVGDCILPWRIPDRLLADYGLCKADVSHPGLRRWVVAIAPTKKSLPPMAAHFMDCAMEAAEEMS